MYRTPGLLLFSMIISTVIAGCSKNSNPVSDSDTVGSGTLHYTFSSPKTIYNPGDTLQAEVTVENSGSATETITVGDGLFHWALLNPVGDTVMAGRVSSTFEELIPADSGKTVTLYSIDRVLEAGSGQTLTTGIYSLKAEVNPISFELRLSIR